MNNIRKSLDTIHYNLSKLMSFNKYFMFVISEREAGKSTAIWMHIWNKFKQGKTTLVLRRKIIDVTYAYITDTLKIFQKFAKDFDIEKISFNKGDCKEGIVDVKYDGQIFFRVIGLSKEMYVLKGLILENIGLMFFDEFICNMRLGEKYLKDEAFKFQELYNTFQRECEGSLPVLFAGNPYSLYNPYFTWLGVDTSKLQAGKFIIGDTYVIECYTLTKELREYILNKNPLYKFDNAYKKYAFNGMAINDMNIRIDKKMPQGYQLKYGFRIDGHFIGIYENSDYTDEFNKFYIQEIDNISLRKKVYCFDFTNLLDRTALVSLEDKFTFQRLKYAFRERKIVFNNLECYYLLEEVYPTL